MGAEHFETKENFANLQPLAMSYHIGGESFSNGVNGGKGADGSIVPAAFKGANGNDLTIDGDGLSAAMATAQGMMSKEQLARANADADIPFRYIQAAGDHGKVPPVSDHAKASAAIPIEKQADVKRFIEAAGHVEKPIVEKPTSVKAQAGDSYWSVAHGVLAQRQGHGASPREVQGMVAEMATLNGKSTKEADTLKIGETIYIPPLKKSH